MMNKQKIALQNFQTNLHPAAMPTVTALSRHLRMDKTKSSYLFCKKIMAGLEKLSPRLKFLSICSSFPRVIQQEI